MREYPDEIGFPEKLADGAIQVKTLLTALCTDDDITLVDGIKQAAGFLNKNRDYSAAQGYHAYFSQQETSVNLLNVAWFTPSQESDDPLTRVHQTLQRYQPTCWAVFRTSTFHKIIAALRPDLPLILQELLWALTALIDGKIKRLPMIYCLRRVDRGYSDGHPFLSIFESPQTYFAQYASYRDALVQQLSPLVNRNRDALTRMLDLSHLSLLTREVDGGMINFFSDHVLANPTASMHDTAIDNALRPAPQHANDGWAKTITRAGVDYHLFQHFLTPEPAEEIHLAAGYEAALIKDICRYFSPNMK
jgi:glycosyltransferase domain-containing protein